MTWEPAPQTRWPDLVSLRAPAASEQARFLPAGTVLQGEPDERLTALPAFLPDAQPVATRAPRVRGVPAAPPAAAAPVRTLDDLAPLEFRRSLFAGASEKDLSDLLTVEWVIAGRDPAAERPTIADLVASQRARVLRVSGALVPLSDAYGGDVQGHLVFLGNRLVEVAVAGTPEAYRAVLRLELRGIAFSTVAWEELHGDGGLLAADVDAKALLAEARRVMRRLAEAPAVADPGATPRAGPTGPWRVRAAVPDGAPPGDVGWLLTTPAGDGLWFEAWPDADVGLLPPPAPTPGGTPDPRRGGGAGVAYLERKIRQLEAMDSAGAFQPRIQRLQRLLDDMRRRR
jgi:hypothetical protein